MTEETVLFTAFEFDRYSMIAWGKTRSTMKVFWPVLRSHGNRLQYDQRIFLGDFQRLYPKVHVPYPETKPKLDIIKKYGNVVYDRNFDRV